MFQLLKTLVAIFVAALSPTRPGTLDPYCSHVAGIQHAQTKDPLIEVCRRADGLYQTNTVFMDGGQHEFSLCVGEECEPMPRIPTVLDRQHSQIQTRCGKYIGLNWGPVDQRRATYFTCYDEKNDRLKECTDERYSERGFQARLELGQKHEEF